MQPNGLDGPTKPVMVKIGGADYGLTWSFLAEYTLSDMGLSLQDVISDMSTRSPSGVAKAVTLLCACLAQDFGLRGQVPPAPQMIASLIKDEEWKAALDGVMLAIKNRQPGQRSMSAAPAETPSIEVKN